jgi:hypothetical protein
MYVVRTPYLQVRNYYPTIVSCSVPRDVSMFYWHVLLAWARTCDGETRTRLGISHVGLCTMVLSGVLSSCIFMHQGTRLLEWVINAWEGPLPLFGNRCAQVPDLPIACYVATMGPALVPPVPDLCMSLIGCFAFLIRVLVCQCLAFGRMHVR